MEFLQKFNGLSLDVKHHTDLTKEKPYDVIYCEFVNTVHGQSLLLTLKLDDEPCFKIFLGARYMKLFNQEIIDKINKNILKMKLLYTGFFTVKGKECAKYNLFL